MRIALSVVVPVAVVLSGNPFEVLEHRGSTVQTSTASAEATSPTTVVSLFNGRDLTGWKPDVPERDADPNGPPSFVVRDGKLVSLGKPEGHLLTDGSLSRLPARGRIPLLRQAWQLRRAHPRLEAARPLQDVPAVHRSADDERKRGRLLGDPGGHQDEGHGEAAASCAWREVGEHRGRRAANREPHRRLREAARGMEHAWSSKRVAEPSRCG